MKLIIDRGKTYKYNSLNYIDENDLEGAIIFKETEECIILYKAINCKTQLYWASTSKESFIKGLSDFLLNVSKKRIYIEFIPEDFVSEMEKIGFKIASEFIDFWNNNINEIQSYQQKDNLLIRELRDTENLIASDITKACKGQSRGFNGEEADSIKEWSESENSKVFIAEIDEKIIGVSLANLYGFESKKGTILWIRLLAVDPTYQCQGVGRSLLNYSIEWGKGKGAQRSFLAVDVMNDRAIKMYQHFGYEKADARGQINMEIDC